MEDDPSDDDTYISVPSMATVSVVDDVSDKVDDESVSTPENSKASSDTDDETDDGDDDGGSKSNTCENETNAEILKQEGDKGDNSTECDTDKQTNTITANDGVVKTNLELSTEKKLKVFIGDDALPIINTGYEGNNSTDSERSGADSVGSEENHDEADEHDNSEDGDSGSEELSCLGDDESGSQSSVEHWTELEVDNEVINKIVIQTPGEKPVLNLQVIGEIRGRALSTDSELAKKLNVTTSVPDRPKSFNAVSTMSKHEISSTNDGHNITKFVGETFNGNNDPNTNQTTGTENESSEQNYSIISTIKTEEYSIESNNTAKKDNHHIPPLNIIETKPKNGGGITDTVNTTKKRVKCDEHNGPKIPDIGVIDTDVNSKKSGTSSDDGDNPVPHDSVDSDNVSDSDTDSSPSSNSELLSTASTRKIDSASSTKTFSPGPFGARTKPNKTNTIDKYDPKYDTKSITSTKSANYLMKINRNSKTTRHTTAVTCRQPLPQRTDRNTKCQDEGCSKYEMDSRLSRKEHIEKLKKIYKENVKLKGIKLKHKSTHSLPDITNTTQRSPTDSSGKSKVYHSPKQVHTTHRQKPAADTNVTRNKSHRDNTDIKLESKNQKRGSLLVKRRQISPGITIRNQTSETIHQFANSNNVSAKYSHDKHNGNRQPATEMNGSVSALNMDKSSNCVLVDHNPRVIDMDVTESALKRHTGLPAELTLHYKTDYTNNIHAYKDKAATGLSESGNKKLKNINSFHNELTALCNKDTDKTLDNHGRPLKTSPDKPKKQPSSRKGSNRRLDVTIKEMIALHGSSLETNDSDFGADKPIDVDHSDSVENRTEEPPTFVTQALIVDMPIQRVPKEPVKTSRQYHSHNNKTNTSRQQHKITQSSFRQSNNETLDHINTPETVPKTNQSSVKEHKNEFSKVESNRDNEMNNTNEKTEHTHEMNNSRLSMGEVGVGLQTIVKNEDDHEQTSKLLVTGTGQTVEEGDNKKGHAKLNNSGPPTCAEINTKLDEKRNKFRSSRTYDNFYKNKLSESFVTIPRKIPNSPKKTEPVQKVKDNTITLQRTDVPNDRIDSDQTSADDQPLPQRTDRNTNCQDEGCSKYEKGSRLSRREHIEKLKKIYKENIKLKDSSVVIAEYVLDLLVNQASLLCNACIDLKWRTKRCTALDDDGDEVLCCILQAPGNKVDPSSFTCDVIDPLDVPPLTKRHELLISHVIKFHTCNVGHIAKEREMVAKIPIAHFFVEPWQEVVIREVDKSGRWIDTGEDVDIVQIPDMGNVVYGVQIALKELTYVAVVTRPRITTVALEYRDKMLSSPSDSRVKLRVPGTSDPRHVSLQSIPITEKIIKEFENTRGPEITSFLTGASPMVILSLEGLNPESFSFAVPFTSVDYVDDYLKDMEAKEAMDKANEEKSEQNEQKDKPVLQANPADVRKVDEKDELEPEDIPNVPPRVRQRMEAELENKQETPKQQSKDKSKLQELELRVHKKQKERYLIQLAEGYDRSLQIKMLDDSDKIKSMDIVTDAAEEFVKFSVYDTYARLFAVEVHDIINFREIQDSVKGLADYLLKHRVRINICQDSENPFSVVISASIDQPFRQRWPTERKRKHTKKDTGSVRFLEMNEGDAIGLTFRGNIEVTNQTQRVFSFHGYRGINAAFDIAIKDTFSQKTLPEFHGAVQVYILKRPRLHSISKTRVQNVSSDWDLFTEYHFMLPKFLKKTPIIINRAPISLRFQEPLTVEFVRLMCKELIKDWDTFAFGLGISNARIQAIKQHNRNQVSERILMDIIVCWMKQQPVARDKVGPVLAALRLCRKTHLESELKQRNTAMKDSRTKTARDKHIQRAALALCQSRSVTVRWRQLFGYLLHLDTCDIKICDMTSEIEEKYKNDATKCYHALQYWKSVSGAPSIWKLIDALRHCSCPVAANTLRVQEYKRLF